MLTPDTVIDDPIPEAKTPFAPIPVVPMLPPVSVIEPPEFDVALDPYARTAAFRPYRLLFAVELALPVVLMVGLVTVRPVP
jgi:hypothetical protein